jgi:hypothetical protein
MKIDKYNKELHMAKYKIGNVYFLKDKITGLIKVGFTSNIERRIKQLRTSNLNLELIYVLENSTMLVEQSLHSFFKTDRIDLEWYLSDRIEFWISKDKLTKQIMKQEGII